MSEETSLTSRTGTAHLDWLARELFGQPAPALTAPYAYAQLTSTQPKAFIWHADPVHIEVARDSLIVQSLEGQAPTADEATQLIAVANELAFAFDAELVEAGGRWFLQLDRELRVGCVPLAAAIDQSMMMPAGNDAGIWNQLHNEIQMAWHAHPVNQRREENGTRTINGLWLHGGGRWQPLPPIAYSQVQSDTPELQGAAQAAGARGVALNADVVDRALLVIDEPLQSQRHEDWTAWSQAMRSIDQRLAAHASDAIDLVLAGATARTFTSRPANRYAFWRS
ncbi:MAG: hypothetical protein ACRECQ_03110, partial [Burkholderiaceae bacterium]